MKFYRPVLKLSIVLGALLLILKVAAPYFVRKEILKLVLARCPECEFQIEKVEISFTKPSIDLLKVVFVSPKADPVVVSAEVEKISTQIYPTALWRKVLSLGEVSVTRPNVKVLEKPNVKIPKKIELPDRPPNAEVEVSSVYVKDGTFSYQHTGILKMQGIELRSDAFGSTERYLDRPAKAFANGILEQSGKFELQVSAQLWEPHLNLDVDLKVDKLNLAELNHFFGPDSGVAIKGQLVSSKGQVVIRKSTALANVYAKYFGLDIHVKPIKGRSDFEAFIANLLVHLSMHNKNTQKPAEYRNQSVKIERNKKEHLISFIFRALKEAALKVASH